MRRTLLLFAAPLALLTGCASAPQAGDQDFGPESGFATSQYGLFLAGQAALADGRSAQAADYFERAREAEALDLAASPEPDAEAPSPGAALAATEADPDDDGRTGADIVAERAFLAALMAGDVSRAAVIAPVNETSSEAGRRLGKLTVAVETLALGKGKAAVQALNEDIGFPHRSAAALLAPWAAAMAGDGEGALVRPEIRGDRLVEYVGQLGQGALFERARRFDEAETDFKALAMTERPTDMAVLAYGGFLERRGRRDEAVALYNTALDRDPHRSTVRAARDRAAAGKPAPALASLREGAAQALMTPAAAMLAANQSQLGLSYLRMVLRLDPQRAEAWLMVGDVLSGAGDVAGAREAYEKPRPGSPEYASARAKLAWTFQAAGDKEGALRFAREAAATGDPDSRLNLADLLRANDQFAESAEVLSGLIAQETKPDWRLLYARGIAYERTGRWPDAERDLLTALKLEPEDSELLNYLGYSWIDRGERLKEAMAMVEKAVGANPRSGAMVDSLGWAHYRLGDYAKAVEFLEQAIGLEAGDPEINNHLGDAYWRVGRRDEAQFQWRRVLTLEPDERVKADAEAKLKSGLGPTGPAQAPKVAGP